jgi:hypothetical protein
MTMTSAPTTQAPLGSYLLDALTAPAPDIDVVAWAGAHLTALEQVVYPTARRVLPNPVALQAQQVRTHELEHALRRLHQRVNGDGATMHLPVARVRDDVRAQLVAHGAGERALEEQLRAVLPTSGWEELEARYRRAVDAAPTRPHPHAPHSGWTGRLARGVLAQLDRVMDGLDARPVHQPPFGG